jgi:peptidoglycan/LPS O-acetylase OafA/YrhL
MQLSLGYAGVTFFYVLSGFILTYTYEALFRGGLHRTALRSFWVARFARVYPVHVVAMTFMLIVLATIGGDHWNAGETVRAMQLATSVLLLQSWFPAQDIHFAINGPAWSISVEAFFYALFPVALVALLRVVRDASERVILFLAVMLCAVYILTLLQVRAQFDQWSLYVFPPVRLVDFALGMLLALAFLRRRAVTSLRVDATMLELAAIAAFFTGLGCAMLLPQSERFSAAFLPFAGLVIYVFAIGKGRVSQWLSAPALVRLGEASYAFYLLHLGIVQVVERALGPDRKAAAWFLALTVSTAASLAVYRSIETPLRRWIRHAWGGNRPAYTMPEAILTAAAGTNSAWQRYSAKAEIP